MTLLTLLLLICPENLSKWEQGHVGENAIIRTSQLHRTVLDNLETYLSYCARILEYLWGNSRALLL